MVNILEDNSQTLEQVAIMSPFLEPLYLFMETLKPFCWGKTNEMNMGLLYRTFRIQNADIDQVLTATPPT